MKKLSLFLTATMATALVSCQQSPPSGTLITPAPGDPLSTPQGVSAQVEVQTPAPTPEPETPQKIKRNPKNYPLAVKTPEADIVLSPHKPYNKVRVDPKKFKSGDLAQDPFTNHLFRVP